MKFRSFLPALLAVCFIISCESDDPIPQEPETSGSYSDGVFILNQGNFGSGNSTVSFLEGDLGGVQHGIFAGANEGKALGDTGQSMAFFENQAFIVVNVSNTIEVVSSDSFESVGTIEEGLHNPRYVSFSGGKLYVTNWGVGDDPADDYVAVYDVDNLTHEEDIPVEEGPEKILEIGGRLYVAHYGGFGSNNILSVIDPVGNTIEQVLEVGDRPNALVRENNILWVGSEGLPEYSGTETGGKIQKIDLGTHEILETFQFQVDQHPQHLSLQNGQVYYTLGSQLFSFPSDQTALPQEPLSVMEEVDVLFALEPIGDLIFAASANADYTSNGKLVIYDTAGELVDSFETGINPGGIFPNL